MLRVATDWLPLSNRIAPIERVKSYLTRHAVTVPKATCYGLQLTPLMYVNPVLYFPLADSMAFMTRIMFPERIF